MEIIKHDSFRSSGTLVNQSDDMERVVIDMTKREFQEFRAKLSHNTVSPKLLDAYSRLEDWCLDNQQHNETVMEILDELDQLRASA